MHKTDYILSHEQGHFDIAEIFARKLNKKMSEYRFDKKTYQKDLNKIYHDILDEKEKMQNDYDKETNHSINKEKQAEWLKKIAKMLEEYKDYADYDQSESPVNELSPKLIKYLLFTFSPIVIYFDESWSILFPAFLA